MGQSGRPAKTGLDREIPAFWVDHLKRATGSTSAREIAREKLGRPEIADAFAGYEAGAHAPNWVKGDPDSAPMLKLSEEVVPGSSRYLTSPMWDLLQNREIAPNVREDWLDQLKNEVTWVRSQAGAATNGYHGEPDRPEVMFARLEAIVALIDKARTERNSSGEQELLRFYAIMSEKMADVVFPGRFAHTIMPFASDWVGEPQSALWRWRTHCAEKAMQWEKVGAALVAIMLSTFLVFGDSATINEVVVIAIPLLGCLIALGMVEKPLRKNPPAATTPIAT